MDNKNSKIEDKSQYSTGEKVHEGTYCCGQCHRSDAVIIAREGQKLGECKYCGYTIWYKV